MALRIKTFFERNTGGCNLCRNNLVEFEHNQKTRDSTLMRSQIKAHVDETLSLQSQKTKTH
jgi:hypothetical protein